MGNTLANGYQQIPDGAPYKLGTLLECISTQRGYIMRCEGYGKTYQEAVSALSKVCEYFDVPKPIQVPGTDSYWYCGLFKVAFLTGLKKKTRYNTVWFIKKNDIYMAYTYYQVPPTKKVKVLED